MNKISEDQGVGIVEVTIRGKKVNVAFKKNDKYSLKIMYPSSFGCVASCPFCNSGKERNTFLFSSVEIIEMINKVAKFVGRQPTYITNEGGGESLVGDCRIIIETVRLLFQKWPEAIILVSSIFPKSSFVIYDELINLGNSNNNFLLQVSLHSFTPRREKLITGEILTPINELDSFAKSWREKTGRKLIGNIVASKITLEEIMNNNKPPVNVDNWIMRISTLNIRDRVSKIFYLKKLSGILKEYGFEVWENIPTFSATSVGAVPGLIN